MNIGQDYKMKSRFLALLCILALYYLSYYALFSLFFTKESRSDDMIRVAVVDSGLDLKDPRFEGHICPTGSKNFVEGETLDGINGHGTHVTGLIQKYAKNSNYCFLIYKYYSDKLPGTVNLQNEVASFRDAVINKADIVNFSGGGAEFDEQEYLIIKDNPQIIFIVSAGNDHQDLDIRGNEYYPASYFLPNEIVVRGVDKYKRLVPSSNYSKRIKAQELGENVLSFLPDGKMGYMTGTSQAAAVHTGKAICKMSKRCK